MPENDPFLISSKIFTGYRRCILQANIIFSTLENEVNTVQSLPKNKQTKNNIGTNTFTNS